MLINRLLLLLFKGIDIFSKSGTLFINNNNNNLIIYYLYSAIYNKKINSALQLMSLSY